MNFLKYYIIYPKSYTVFCVFILISVNVFSQLENIPLVTVKGEATIKAVPDMVIIGVKVDKAIQKGNKDGFVGIEIFKKEDTRIRLFDFDEKNIEETFIQYKYDKYTKELFITIFDIQKLDKILVELYKLGFKDYLFIDYRLQNYEALKLQAQEKAVAAAKHKAEALVRQTGQTLGAIHTITETNTKSYNWYNIDDFNKYKNTLYQTGADDYPIQPGYITINASLIVSFDLNK